MGLMGWFYKSIKSVREFQLSGLLIIHTPHVSTWWSHSYQVWSVLIVETYQLVTGKWITLSFCCLSCFTLQIPPQKNKRRLLSCEPYYKRWQKVNVKDDNIRQLFWNGILYCILGDFKISVYIIIHLKISKHNGSEQKVMTLNKDTWGCIWYVWDLRVFFRCQRNETPTLVRWKLDTNSYWAMWGWWWHVGRCSLLSCCLSLYK